MIEKNISKKIPQTTAIPSKGQRQSPSKEKEDLSSKAVPNDFHGQKLAAQSKKKKAKKLKAPLTTQAFLAGEMKDQFNLQWPLLVFLLALLLPGLFFFRRFSLKVHQQRKQIEVLKVQNDRLRQLPFELQAWEKEINQVKEFFLDKEEIISFFNFLEAISPGESLKFSFQEQEAVVDSQGRLFLRLILTAEGDWQSETLPFLNSLFHGPYLILPEKVSLESTDDIFKRVRASVVARIYVDQDFIAGDNP